MSLKYYCLYLFLLASFLNTNGQTNLITKAEIFNETSLLDNLKILSSDLYEGRRTGTKGVIRAKRFIINEFSKLDVLALSKSYEQSFLFQTRGKEYLQMF